MDELYVRVYVLRGERDLCIQKSEITVATRISLPLLQSLSSICERVFKPHLRGKHASAKAEYFPCELTSVLICLFFFIPRRPNSWLSAQLADTSCSGTGG